VVSSAEDCAWDFSAAARSAANRSRSCCSSSRSAASCRCHASKCDWYAESAASDSLSSAASGSCWARHSRNAARTASQSICGVTVVIAWSRIASDQPRRHTLCVRLPKVEAASGKDYGKGTADPFGRRATALWTAIQRYVTISPLQTVCAIVRSRGHPVDKIATFRTAMRKNGRTRRRRNSRRKSHEPAESRASEVVTLAWTVSVTGVLVADLIVVAAHLYVRGHPRAEPARALEAIMLLSAAIMGAASLALLPVVWRTRLKPPQGYVVSRCSWRQRRLPCWREDCRCEATPGGTARTPHYRAKLKNGPNFGMPQKINTITSDPIYLSDTPDIPTMATSWRAASKNHCGWTGVKLDCPVVEQQQ
jgi:hypothetical protein